MARIASVNIPTNKRLVIGLTYIYGLGYDSAEQICKKSMISENKRVKDLTDQELIILRNIIETEYKVEGDLRREVNLNIKKKKDIRYIMIIIKIKLFVNVVLVLVKLI